MSSVEPIPISKDIHRVQKVPFNAFSNDILRNAHDLCLALEPLKARQDNIIIKNHKKGEFVVSPATEGDSTNSSLVPSKQKSSAAAAAAASRSSVHLYDYQQERWMDRYNELSAFFQSHGHSDVSNEFDANLAGWVRRQRHQFKRAKQGRRSTLTVARVQLLDRVGFKWDSHDLAWVENFERLKTFYKIHKHCNVSSSFIESSDVTGNREDHEKLLNWCKRQKRAIRMYLKNKDRVGSRMTPQRFEMLKSLGFRWESQK
jgi:hypothetical protein